MRWGGGNSAEDKMWELCIISAKLKCRLLKTQKNKDLLCNTFLKGLYTMFSTADPELGSFLVPNSLRYEALGLLKAVKMLSWIGNNRFEMAVLTVLC